LLDFRYALSLEERGDPGKCRVPTRQKRCGTTKGTKEVRARGGQGKY